MSEEYDKLVELAIKNVRLSRDLAAARRECAELRERVVEEIARFIESQAIYSWVPGIIAKRIRALTKPASPRAATMTETIMNQDEKKFWDAADRADERYKNPNTPTFKDTSEAVEWDKKCR